MKLQGTYLGDLRCEFAQPATGAVLGTDARMEETADRSGMCYPTELLAAALGACTMTVLGFVARRLEVDVTGTKVEVEHVMTEDHHKVAKIEVTYILPAGDWPAKVRKQFERAVRRCPVHASLHPDIEQVFNFVWPE
ncbi:MAG: OsmC family protein [Desulfovibrionaceae bacterium]|nr:OsmC family protein [Desulfovibrionaceae bacterium]